MIEVGHINYEEEYENLKKTNERLQCKVVELKCDVNLLQKENSILKAQLDMVHLIFGKK